MNGSVGMDPATTPPAEGAQASVTESSVTESSVTEEEITRFVVERFLPGVDPTELEPEYDLLATAVIDSLAVLRIAAWLKDEHGVMVPDRALATRNFRTVRAIATTASARQGAA